MKVNSVGKYVVGPTPKASVSIEVGDIGAVLDGQVTGDLSETIAAVKGAATGSESPGADSGEDTSALPTLADSEMGENAGRQFKKNVDVGVNGNVGEIVNEHGDENVEKNDDQGAIEGVIENFDENITKDSKSPRVPPNTPAAEERIWWRNEFFVIKKSALGGLGAFAARDLDYGDKILEEMPLLLTNNWGICNEYDCLSDEDRELFHTLHKFSSNPGAHDIEKIRRANS
jgi:hypothetical protein